MSSGVFLTVAMASLAMLAISFFGIIYVFSSRVPPRIRLNMDEVPPTLSKLWWVVNFFQYYVVKYLPNAFLTRRQKLLASAGLEFFLTTEETYALQCLAATIFFLLTAFIGVVAGIPIYVTGMLCFVTTFLGWFYPLMWLMDQKKKRVLAILKSMPAFLDILTLCCECGLNLNSGLVHYCEKGPRGPLRSEMERVLRDMKGGATRVESLTKLSLRMSNPDLAMFVSIVAQCEKLGVPLGDALRRFSEQKRTERFQRAEKLAMEAPMKIIGPLVIFIFPITFIVIAFPIVISMLENFR